MPNEGVQNLLKFVQPLNTSDKGSHDMSISINQFYFIIVEPQTPGNIGSICRACTNMGIKNVVLVNPVDYLVDDTFRFGWGSEELIRNLRVVNTLEEIVSEMDVTVATTQRRRENQCPLYSPKELYSELDALPSSAKIGILFGRENNGLSNEEALACNYQSTIPSAVSYPALNLSQAVMVYGYELFQVAHDSPTPYQWTLASKGDQERLYSIIGEAVDTLPFKTRNGTAAFINLFRRVLGRTRLETRDVRVLYKLFGLIKKK